MNCWSFMNKYVLVVILIFTSSVYGMIMRDPGQDQEPLVQLDDLKGFVNGYYAGFDELFGEQRTEAQKLHNNPEKAGLFAAKIVKTILLHSLPLYLQIMEQISAHCKDTK